MSTLFVNGKIEEDTWLFVDGEQAVPEGVDVIVSLSVFESQERILLTRNSGKLGVYLEAGEQVDSIADHLDQLSLVSLDFPSYADGRAFSKARLLRDKYGFSGQVRAVGDVRVDQVSHMRRSGCDALVVAHPPTIARLINDKDTGLDLFYQPGAGDAETMVTGKAWARRVV